MARSDDYYKRLEEEEKKVRDIGGFNYSRQADYDAAWQRLNNREPFKYDLNKDALYKQYKDQYAALGKLAMQDTIGQASAMTGGYGNSYALTAGQQMYNQYMQKPNEMIPTLYGMARDRYDAEGNDLRNQFNLLAADRDYQYGLYNDAYNKALAERDYANTQFNNERSFELQQAAAAAAARSSRGGGGRSSGGSKSKSKGKDNESVNQTQFLKFDKQLIDRDDFLSKGMQAKYGTYKGYIKTTIDEWYDNGWINEATARALWDEYDLGNNKNA